MPSSERRSRLVAAVLVAGLFGLAFLAAEAAGPALAPDASASTNCVYSVCPNNTGGISLGTIEAIVALLAVVAVVLGVLIWRDRRRAANRPPPNEWSDSPLVDGGAAGAAAGGAAAYTEGPEDVSVPPPELPATGTPGGAGEGGEADIDSLMAELDRISGEILKQGPKGKKGSGGSPPAEGGGSDGGAS